MNGGDCSVENSIEKDEQAEQDFTIDLSEIQSTNSQGQDVIENNQQSNKEPAGNLVFL